MSRKFAKTIVMVTHDPHAASYADVVYHLEKGRLLAGDPAAVSAAGSIQSGQEAR
jgi:putative ABC transport system ATP-binding protein